MPGCLDAFLALRQAPCGTKRRGSFAVGFEEPGLPRTERCGWASQRWTFGGADAGADTGAGPGRAYPDAIGIRIHWLPDALWMHSPPGQAITGRSSCMTLTLNLDLGCLRTHPPSRGLLQLFHSSTSPKRISVGPTRLSQPPSTSRLHQPLRPPTHSAQPSLRERRLPQQTRPGQDVQRPSGITPKVAGT